jgi:PKD repeat protein
LGQGPGTGFRVTVQPRAPNAAYEIDHANLLIRYYASEDISDGKEKSPSHRYTAAGNYAVKLSAQGFNVDSTIQTITILPAYVSIQIDTIQVQAVPDGNGTVTGYFKITDGNSYTYWQSGNVSINTYQEV